MSGDRSGEGPPRTGEGGSSDDDGMGLALILLLALLALPVIAIIAVVVLVILAAVLGTFVLGIGSTADTAGPQASFDFEYADGAVVVTHGGGETIDASDVRVVVDGELRGTWADFEGDGSITEGDTIRIPGVESGATVELLWESPEGETEVIGSYTVT